MKILISPGYTPGLYGVDNGEEELFVRTATHFEDGPGDLPKSLRDVFVTNFCQAFEEKFGREFSDTGFFYRDLAIVEIPEGKLFKIREYDGAEYPEIFEPDEWHLSTK